MKLIHLSTGSNSMNSSPLSTVTMNKHPPAVYFDLSLNLPQVASLHIPPGPYLGTVVMATDELIRFKTSGHCLLFDSPPPPISLLLPQSISACYIVIADSGWDLKSLLVLARSWKSCRHSSLWNQQALIIMQMTCCVKSPSTSRRQQYSTLDGSKTKFINSAVTLQT